MIQLSISLKQFLPLRVKHLKDLLHAVMNFLHSDVATHWLHVPDFNKVRQRAEKNKDKMYVKHMCYDISQHC